MSYILEALKKAQAERQLGQLPSIHAAPLQGNAADVRAARFGKPLWLALAAMSVAVVVLSYLMWKQNVTPAAVPVVAPAPVASQNAPAPLAAAAAAAAPVAAAPEPFPDLLAEARTANARVVAERAAAQRAQAASDGGAAGKPKKDKQAPARDGDAVTGAAGVDGAASVSAVAAASQGASSAKSGGGQNAAPAAMADEAVLWLRELPEPIQHQIPALSMGGYMYSKNPADRLVIIDKVLRHEGEEVAPGIVLEKLQAKSAVFSFKGYRYRVAY